MGTYGFIRFSLPFFPDVLTHSKVRSWMIVLSIIAIIYGALVSLMQKDMKKLVAYSSVSHLGFCTLGIFALTPLGLSGSVLQQINHGISTGALFLIVGILYERRHTREISEYGGISNVMPVYATITMIMFLSSMGLPLLNGFVGEFTILQGTFMVRSRGIPATSGSHGPSPESSSPRRICSGSISVFSSARSPIRKTKSCTTSRRAKWRCSCRSSSWPSGSAFIPSRFSRSLSSRSIRSWRMFATRRRQAH